MSEKLNVGQFPVMQTTNRSKFVQHQQSMPQRVELPDGEFSETGYIKITDDQSIDLYALCQNNGDAQKLSIKAIVYIDEGDNLQVHDITRMAPVVLNDTAYVDGIIQIGHVTKLCGLRWGFNVTFNKNTGAFQIEVDKESPIVGLKLQFD